MSQCPRVGMSQTGPNQVQCRAATLEVEKKIVVLVGFFGSGSSKSWQNLDLLLMNAVTLFLMWHHLIIQWSFLGSIWIYSVKALKVNRMNKQLRDSEFRMNLIRKLTKLQIPLNARPFLGGLWWILTSSYLPFRGWLHMISRVLVFHPDLTWIDDLWLKLLKRAKWSLNYFKFTNSIQTL